MVVLVTGSSRGIGASVIRKFAIQGYDVVINYNNSRDEALALQKEINKYNVKSLVVKCDISKEEEVKEMVDTIVKEFGGIDVLVNNAGIARDSLFEDKSVEDFRRVIDVNLIGTFIVSREVGKVMFNNGGSIINIASTNGINTGYPESLDYDSSKAGVISLTHNLAKVYAPKVRVNAVCPGWVDTDMNRELDEDFRKMECEKILLGRFGTCDEIADVVYFITQASYVNDSIIRVDGGESA